MTFPANWPVLHQPYVGLDLDELNKEVPAWDDGVVVKIQTFRVTNTEQLVAAGQPQASRQVREAVMTTPPSLPVQVRDRFTVRGELYEVYEVKNVDMGLVPWQPGNVLKLKRITPAGRPV